MMDHLVALHAFAKTAETGSFTRAGRQLGVSSSAVGKAVARLEARLGVRLFHRSTRAITLTAEGTRLLERCRRIFSEVEAAELELAESRSAPSGRLRVSLPLAGMLMMPTLTAFMANYPDVELDLDFTDRLVDVIEEGFDVVIRAGDVRDSRLMSRTLGEFRLMLVASPTYLAGHPPVRRPEDLAAHACLHHRYATSGKLEPWPLGEGLDLPQAAVANTIEPLIYMAEQGRGIACLPDFAIRSQLKAGALTQILEPHTRHEGLFRILWPSRRLPTRLRVFIDFVANNLFTPGESADRSGAAT